MESKQSLRKRAEAGKEILSKQPPFTLEELKEQIQRLNRQSSQVQKKKHKV